MSAGVMPLIRLACERLRRPDAGELFAGFGAKLGESAVVEAVGNSLFREPRLAIDFGLLPGDVAGVLHVAEHLLRRPRGSTAASSGSRATTSAHSASGRRRYLVSVRAVDPGRVEQVRARDSISRELCLRAGASGRRRPGRSRWASGVSRRSALSCRSSSRYSARLVNMRYGSSTPQVTRSSISTPMYACVAVQDERLAAQQRERRVRAGDQPLGGRLFVAGRAVDLAGEVQPGDALRFQRRLQLVGRRVVVFDRVAVAHDLGALQAGDQRGRCASCTSRGRLVEMPLT